MNTGFSVQSDVPQNYSLLQWHQQVTDFKARAAAADEKTALTHKLGITRESG